LFFGSIYACFWGNDAVFYGSVFPCPLPMQKDIEWGYLIPYMITGMLNEHPRAAIEMRKTADKDKYAKFYEEIRDVTA